MLESCKLAGKGLCRWDLEDIRPYNKAGKGEYIRLAMVVAVLIASFLALIGSILAFSVDCGLPILAGIFSFAVACVACACGLLCLSRMFGFSLLPCCGKKGGGLDSGASSSASLPPPVKHQGSSFGGGQPSSSAPARFDTQGSASVSHSVVSGVGLSHTQENSAD